MKIHLPNSLRAALLACMTVISPAAVTISSASAFVGAASYVLLASSANAEDYTYDSYTATTYAYFTDATAADTITMNLDGTGTSYFADAFTCNAGTIQVDSWIINNGSSNKAYVFNSAITGSGPIEDAWSGGANNTYNFTGDMSQFSGDIIAADLLNLNFGTYDVSVATSGENGLGSASGTGALSSTGSNSITYNFTQYASVLNSSITTTGATVLSFLGGATYNVSSEISVAGEIVIDGGSSLWLAASAAGVDSSITASTLSIGSGSSLVVGSSQAVTVSSMVLTGGSSINNYGTITINGSLTLDGEDQVSITSSGSLVLSSGSSISIDSGESLLLSGSVYLSQSGQIDNGGTLTLADGFIFDVSAVALDGWTYDSTTGRYTFDLVTGISGLDGNVVTIDNISGINDDLMTDVAVSDAGVLSFVFADDVVFFTGGELLWEDGGEGVTTFDGRDTTFENGSNITFMTSDADVTLAGDIEVNSLTVSASINLTLEGGDYELDCAKITLMSNSTLTLEDDCLSSGTLFNSSSDSDSTIIFNATDDSTVFNYGSQLQSYTGNLELTSGHLTLSATDTLNFASLTLNGNDVSVTFGSETNLGSLIISDETSILESVINVSANTTVTVAGGANKTGQDAYYRSGSTSANGSQAIYTINLGEDAVLSDNVKLWVGSDAVNVTGQGTYEVSGLVLGYEGSGTIVEFTVGSGAAVIVVGQYESADTGNSFVMGGSEGLVTTLNVDGTLVINSQITHVDGLSATMEVNNGGTLYLNKGFAVSNATEVAANLQINVSSGAYILVGEQKVAQDYSDLMIVNMASGSGLGSNGVDDVTTVYHTIVFEQGGTNYLYAEEDKTLVMNSALNNAGTVTLTGGGSFSFAQSNDVNTMNVTNESTLSLTSGVSLFSSSGQLNLASGSTLDMSAGGGIISGSVSLNNESKLYYAQGVAGASVSNGLVLNVSSGNKVVVGFTEEISTAFTQVLFTGLSSDNISTLGLSSDYYNGLMGCAASSILSADDSWELTEGSYVYLTDDGSLVLKNLAKNADWAETEGGVWSDTSMNWEADGELGQHDESRTLNFGTDPALTKDVVVDGTVSTGYVNIYDDYTFKGGTIIIDDALTIDEETTTDDGVAVVDATVGVHVTIDSKLVLNDALLIIGDNSSLSMNNTTLTLNVAADEFLNDAETPLFQIGTDASLELNNTTLTIARTADSETASIDISKYDGTILVLADADKLDFNNVTLTYEGSLVDKYFTNVTLSNGVLKGDINYNSYNSSALTENGAAGLNMMSKVLVALNPQWTDSLKSDDAEKSALAQVLDTLDTYSAAGNKTAMDEVGAAIAGASTTSLGTALMGDVQRQLASVRNRTKAMGVDPSVANDDMPYFNAWISAEGAYSKLSSDGTMSGYTLNSVGASIGVDVDLTENFSMGLAYSALQGSLSADAAGTSDGDVNTMYGSLYARVYHKRWSHSFVAAFGTADIELERKIATTSGSVSAKGSTNGSTIGLMYEVGYTYALDEEASSCIQPLFSISYLKSQVDGYSEKNSDIALNVSDQSLNNFNIGVGTLYETVVGEDIYNRASVLSARAMVKYTAGDRSSEADVSLIANNGVTETVKGAEYGAVGLELGVGLSIPVTSDSGTLFVDASCDFRSGQNSFSGTLGYRFSF